MNNNDVPDFLKPVSPEEALKKFTINLTDSAKSGKNDPVFGARPLRRAIEEKLVDEVAMRIIDGNIKPGDIISPKIEKDRIVL